MLDSVFILGGFGALAQWSPAIAARSAFDADSAWAAQLPGEAENAQAARREGLPAVAVDGPGFLVLRDGAHEVYARSARFNSRTQGNSSTNAVVPFWAIVTTMSLARCELPLD